MPRCYFCDKEMTTTKQCANCRHAVYCSKDCQKKHWSKHKPNCVRSDHSIHGLFDCCSSDFLPDPGSTVARDYGFDNVRVNHGDVLWGISSTPCLAENILIGLYQFIRRDVVCLETPGESRLVFSSIGASKKMIVEAMENNKLDDFIHLYIKNVFSRHGPHSPQYCFGWIWNRMVIGPTRTGGLTRQQTQEMRRTIYHKHYGSTEPGNCCCSAIENEPAVPFPFL